MYAIRSYYELTVRISRFDPAHDQNPHIEKYTVDVNEGARILNVLQAVQVQDPTLSFRSSCRAGQCGSCAVRVNGEPALACMTEATDEMLIEPLDLSVIKDLTVELVQGINKIPRIHPCDCHDIPDQAQIAKLKPLRDCRITSYNVCYTKLLRGTHGTGEREGNQNIPSCG